MGEINNYAVKALKENDKLLASDGDTGKTKNVSAVDVAEMNGGASIYRAFVSQSITSDPIATVVGANTIGDIVWTRTGAGIYRATLADAFSGYVAVMFGTPQSELTLFTVNSMNSDYIVIGTMFNGSFDDSLLDNQYIEIRVY